MAKLSGNGEDLEGDLQRGMRKMISTTAGLRLDIPNLAKNSPAVLANRISKVWAL